MTSSGQCSPRNIPLPDTPQYPMEISHHNTPNMSAAEQYSPEVYSLDIDEVERDSAFGSHQEDSSSFSEPPSPCKEDFTSKKGLIGQATFSPPGKDNFSGKKAASIKGLQAVSDDEELSPIKTVLTKLDLSPKKTTFSGRTSELRKGLVRLKTIPDATMTEEKNTTSDGSDVGSKSPAFTPSPQTSSAKEMSDDSEKADTVTEKELPAIPQRTGRLERIFKDRLGRVSQRISVDFRKKKFQFGLDIMTPSPSKVQQCTCGQCVCSKSSGKETDNKDDDDPDSAEEYVESTETLAPKAYDPSSPDACKDGTLDAKKLPTPSDESLGINKRFILIKVKDQQCTYCSSNFHGTTCCSELFPPSGVKPHKNDHTTFCPTEHMLVDAYAKKIKALRQLLDKVFTLELPPGSYDPEGCQYCGSHGHTLALCRRLFPFLDFKALILCTEPQVTDPELVERYANQMRAFGVDSHGLIRIINECIRDVARETYLTSLYDVLTNGSPGVITVAHVKAALHGITRDKIEYILPNKDKESITKAFKNNFVLPSSASLSQFMIPDANALLRRARAKLNESEHDAIACESERLCAQKRNIVLLEGEEGYHFRECVLALRTQQFRNKLESQGDSTFEARIEERSERKAIENALLRATILELASQVESLRTTLRESEESKGAPVSLPIGKRELGEKGEQSGEKDSVLGEKDEQSGVKGNEFGEKGGELGETEGSFDKKNEKPGENNEESGSDKENEESIEKVTEKEGIDWFWFT